MQWLGIQLLSITQQHKFNDSKHINNFFMHVKFFKFISPVITLRVNYKTLTSVTFIMLDHFPSLDKAKLDSINSMLISSSMNAVFDKRRKFSSLNMREYKFYKF